MRLWMGFVLAAVILSGCGTTEPDVSDWCFAMDLREDDYGFDIIRGEWRDNRGFVSDSANVIEIEYDHGAFVAPTAVTVSFGRADIVDGALLPSLSAAAEGAVFGIPVDFVETLPSGVPSAQLTLAPRNIGDGGTTIRVRVETTDPIAITQLRVVGDGVATYPLAWDCNTRPQGPTPTATAPTPSPTPSPTGTLTPTPTATVDQTLPPPTATRDLSCRQAYRWTGSATPEPVMPPAQIVLQQNFPANSVYRQTASPFRWFWQRDTANAAVPVWSLRLNGVSEAVPASLNQFRFVASAGVGGSMRVEALRNNDVVASTVVPATISTINDQRGFAIPAAWDTLRIIPVPNNGNQFWWFAGQLIIHVCAFDVAPTPTPSPTVTNTPTATATTTFTPLPPTRTPIPTATPRPPTRTPIPTLTPRPASTSTPRPSATPITVVGTPTPGNPTVTAIPPASPTPFFPSPTPGGATATPGGPTATPGGATATPGGPTATPGGPPIDGGGFDPNAGFNGIAAPLDEWIDIANYAGQIAASTATLFGMYGGEAFTLGLGLLNAFVNAPPLPIPGLPDCARAPLLHELCAVWYILDWTFLAPGTPGALIVPLLNVLMIIGIVIAVIQLILRIINRGDNATGVS